MSEAEDTRPDSIGTASGARRQGKVEVSGPSCAIIRMARGDKNGCAYIQTCLERDQGTRGRLITTTEQINQHYTHSQLPILFEIINSNLYLHCKQKLRKLNKKKSKKRANEKSAKHILIDLKLICLVYTLEMTN